MRLLPLLALLVVNTAEAQIAFRAAVTVDCALAFEVCMLQQRIDRPQAQHYEHVEACVTTLQRSLPMCFDTDRNFIYGSVLVFTKSSPAPEEEAPSLAAGALAIRG